MKAIIILRYKRDNEIFNFFGNIQPPLLPIAGKQLIAYWIDFFAMMGVREIRIATEGHEGLIEECIFSAQESNRRILYRTPRVEDGNPKKVPIKYYRDIEFSHTLLNEHDTRRQAFLKNKGFWADEDTYYIYGFGFLFYNQTYVSALPKLFVESAVREGSEHFFWGKLSAGKLNLPRFKQSQPKRRSLAYKYPAKKIVASRLETCYDYYNLSMALLSKYADHFLLCSEDEQSSAKASVASSRAFVGEKVIIRKGSRLIEDFIIGDRVVVEEECQIGKNTILSNDVFVDEGTRVLNSIVLPKTYLGKWLNIVDAIVYHETLIHIPSGHIINFKDDFIAGHLRQHKATASLRRLSDRVVAGALLLSQFPMQLFLTFLANEQYAIKRERQLCYLNVGYDIIELWRYNFRESGLLIWLFMQFFLDKRDLLKLVLQGKLALIGSHPLEVTLGNKLSIQSMRFYAPGAFWYSEAVASFSNDEQENMVNDLYFLNYRIPFKNFRVFFKILFRRFFKWA